MPARTRCAPRCAPRRPHHPIRRVRPDVVTIRSFRDPVSLRSRITGVCVIGSSSPCTSLLKVGLLVRPAVDCLLRNGFRVIAVRKHVVVLRRYR